MKKRARKTVTEALAAKALPFAAAAVLAAAFPASGSQETKSPAAEASLPASGSQTAQDPESLMLSPEAEALMREPLPPEASSPASALMAVQERLISKNWLPEAGFGISPALTGFTYTGNYSMDFSGRLYINDRWAAHIKYSRFYSPNSAEGREAIKASGKIPVEMKRPQKWAALAGLDWLPFYGKGVLLSRVFHFDIYFSASGGVLEQLRASKKTALYSIGTGAVFWLHRRFSARLELNGSGYSRSYAGSDGRQHKERVYITRVSLSGGFLF